jgi:hypothetical protein
MWLNDRLGQSLAVWIWLEYGDSSFRVFEAEGELRHWTEGQPHVLGAPTLDELQGRYRIGDAAAVDLSDVRPLEVTTGPDDHLHVRLDENTTLEVVEQDDDV